MKKRASFIFLLTFVIAVITSGASFAYEAPKIAKIIKEDGITVRELPDSKSESVDVVYSGYVYEIIDVNPIYYKIELENGSIGWIYANKAKGWTKENNDSSKVKITLESGITTRYKAYDRDSEIVGIAKANQEYKIHDVIFSHYQVSTPRNKMGWIYIGTPDEPWIQIME